MTEWTATLMSVAPQEAAPPVFAAVEDLDFSSLVVVDELGVGSCDVTLPVDAVREDSTRGRLLDVWRSPCELWVWRDSAQVFAGKVVAVRVDGRQLTVTARGLLVYLAGMASDVDQVFREDDQATIVKTLVDYYQALEFGHFGLDTTDLTPTGVSRDLTLLGVAPVTFDRVFSEMGGRSEGFDLWADPATRRLYTRSPWRGSDLSGSVIVDDRQVVSSSWQASCAPGQVASDIITASSSPGGGTLIGRAADTDLRAQAGRWTASQNFYDITRQETIDAHAAQLVRDLGRQVISTSSQLIPVDLTFGQVGAGDTITFDHDFGLGFTSAARRLAQVAVTVNSAGERVAVEFV